MSSSLEYSTSTVRRTPRVSTRSRRDQHSSAEIAAVEAYATVQHAASIHRVSERQRLIRRSEGAHLESHRAGMRMGETRSQALSRQNSQRRLVAAKTPPRDNATRQPMLRPSSPPWQSSPGSQIAKPVRRIKSLASGMLGRASLTSRSPITEISAEQPHQYIVSHGHASVTTSECIQDTDAQLQVFNQRRLKPQGSFLDPIRRQAGQAKSSFTHDSTLPPFNMGDEHDVFVTSEPPRAQSPLYLPKSRKASGTIRQCFKRVFGRQKTPSTTIPSQHIVSTEFHFDPDKSTTAPPSREVSSRHDSVLDNDSMKYGSRVTSWTDSTAGGNARQTRQGSINDLPSRRSKDSTKDSLLGRALNFSLQRQSSRMHVARDPEDSRRLFDALRSQIQEVETPGTGDQTPLSNKRNAVYISPTIRTVPASVETVHSDRDGSACTPSEWAARRHERSQNRWRDILRDPDRTPTQSGVNPYNLEEPSMPQEPWPLTTSCDSGTMKWRDALSPSIYSQTAEGQPCVDRPIGTAITITGREVKKYAINTREPCVRTSSDWREWLSDNVGELARTDFAPIIDADLPLDYCHSRPGYDVPSQSPAPSEAALSTLQLPKTREHHDECSSTSKRIEPAPSALTKLRRKVSATSLQAVRRASRRASSSTLATTCEPLTEAAHSSLAMDSASQTTLHNRQAQRAKSTISLRARYRPSTGLRDSSVNIKRKPALDETLLNITAGPYSSNASPLFKASTAHDENAGPAEFSLTKTAKRARSAKALRPVGSMIMVGNEEGSPGQRLANDFLQSRRGATASPATSRGNGNSSPAFV